ncbi:hypothetical protein V8E53_006353 [Lactarius tabidus]
MKKIIRQRAAESSDRSSRREQLARRLSGERAGPWKRSKPLFSYIDGHLIGLRAVYVHHPDGCLGYPSISGLQTKIYARREGRSSRRRCSFLTITDPNPIDKEGFEHDREAYLQSTARDGLQLLPVLFNLPTLSSPEGSLAQLPPPTTQLLRTKPLPKPKPKPNGSALRTLKVSSPSGARRTYRTTSGRRGSRAGGGKARTGRRRHSDYMRYLPTLTWIMIWRRMLVRSGGNA